MLSEEFTKLEKGRIMGWRGTSDKLTPCSLLDDYNYILRFPTIYCYIDHHHHRVLGVVRAGVAHIRIEDNGRC